MGKVEPIDPKAIIDLVENAHSFSSGIGAAMGKIVYEHNKLVAAHNEQEEKLEQILKVLPKKG